MAWYIVVVILRLQCDVLLVCDSQFSFFFHLLIYAFVTKQHVCDLLLFIHTPPFAAFGCSGCSCMCRKTVVCCVYDIVMIFFFFLSFNCLYITHIYINTRYTAHANPSLFFCSCRRYDIDDNGTNVRIEYTHMCRLSSVESQIKRHTNKQKIKNKSLEVKPKLSYTASHGWAHS